MRLSRHPLIPMLEAAGRFRRRWRDFGLPSAAGALAFVGHYLYGALVSDVALWLGAALAMLTMAALADPRLRADIARLRGLTWIAAAFAVTLALAALSMTGLVGAAVHPVWGYLGLGPPAITIDKSSTAVEIVKLLVLACLFVVGLTVGASRRRARFAIYALIVLGAAFGLWAAFGSATGLIVQTQGRRLEAHFLNPNTAGTLFAALAVLTVPVLLAARRDGQTNQRAIASGLLGAASLVFVVALLMSASRGAVVAFIVALVFFALMRVTLAGEARSRSVWVGAGVAILGGLAVYYAGDLVIERSLQSGEAASDRVAIWAAHWRAFQAAPLFGYGLGTSETVNRTLIDTANFGDLWNIRAVLNVYLQWLEQAGIAGAAAMFSTIGVIVFVTLAKTLQRRETRLILLGLLAVDVVFLVHGATDFALETPSMAMMWAYLLGLQFSLAQVRRSRGEPSITRQGRAATGGAFGLALATGIACLVSLAALRGAAIPLGPLGPYELAAGQVRRAQGLLDGTAANADDLDQAVAASQRALSLYPYDTGARLRIALADSRRNGALSTAGLDALRQSYDLVAIEPQYGNWRVRFALDHWPELTPGLRQAVRREFETLWASPPHRRLVRANLQTVSNPAGRLAGALWLERVSIRK